MKEFYVLGKPIETNIGNLHFMTVTEYYDFIKLGYLNCLILSKDDLLKKLKELENTVDPNIKTVRDVLSELSLFEFVQMVNIYCQSNQVQDSYIGLLQLDELCLNFRRMFEFCFKEDVFYKITNETEFESLRDLIIEINCIPYEKPNPNPEIEKFNQMRRLMQKNKGESLDFESMYTSVGLVFGKDPDNMTLYKFNKYFNRLAQFKNHESTTLFATVSSDVKIESWYKADEEKKEALQTISEEELKNRSQKKL